MENAVEIKINENFVINVNVYPTIEEKLAFIQAVTSDIDVNSTVYQTLVEAKFDVLFLTVFTDYVFPEETKDENGKLDIGKAYNHIRDINIRYHFRRYELPKGCFPLNVLITLLETDIKNIINIENQKNIAMFSRNMILEETLENISTLVDKGIDFLNSAMTKFNDVTAESLSESMNEIVNNIPEQLLSNVTKN